MYVGRVYKIIHNQSDAVYIGSTKNELRYRWTQHRCMFKKWLENKKLRGCTIFQYFEKYGIENFSICLIREYDVCDSLHLKAWEQLWINKLRCINEKNPNPLMTKKQRDRNDYIKHRLERIAKVREYAAANKEKIAERNKTYREKNKERMREKVTCECGESISRHALGKHKKSVKHQNSSRLEYNGDLPSSEREAGDIQSCELAGREHQSDAAGG